MYNIDSGFDTQQGSFSSKVSFSVKLGALAPSHFEHERRARPARLGAISNQGVGAVWQIAAPLNVHERATWMAFTNQYSS